MAAKRRFLDVWIVETKMVYREVPFAVVTDWIQQGRLLPDDRARPSGSPQWHRLGAIPAFAAYWPRSEPQRVDDQAEALTPVEVEFSWKRRPDQEEDDPDMIPLIDVTLVLLIFFMMSAAVSAGLFSPIDTPPAKHQLHSIETGTFWIGIDKDERYSLGQDETELAAAGRDPQPVLDRLKAELDKLTLGGTVRVSIRADQTLKVDIVQKLSVELQRLEKQVNVGRDESKQITLALYGEVSPAR